MFFFSFFNIQHYLSPSKSLTPFTASLTASLSFARIGQSPRRRAVFLHQAVLESLHHTVCLLASGCAWFAPPHRLLACIRLCLIRSTKPFACLHQVVLESLHHTVCLLASGSGDDDYEVTGQGCGPRALTLGNSLLRFERGRICP